MISYWAYIQPKKNGLVYYLHTVQDQQYNCKGASNLPTSCMKQKTHTVTHTHCPFLTSVLPGFTLPSRISRSDPCPTHSFGSGVFGTSSSPSSASFFAASSSTSAGGCQGVCVCVAKRYILHTNISIPSGQKKTFYFQVLSLSEVGLPQRKAMPGRQHTRLATWATIKRFNYLSTSHNYVIKGIWRQVTGSSKTYPCVGLQSGAHCCNRQCQMKPF